jgi:diguanylate cyclase (GGDEF)-like protein
MPLAGAILVVGLIASIAAGTIWRANLHAHAAQAFQTEATEATANVEATLRRDTDFLGGLRVVLAEQPDLDQDGFEDLYTRLETSMSQVGPMGATFVRSVPAEELPSFLARRSADRAFREHAGGALVPLQADGAARYCLTSIVESALGVLDRPLSAALQGDWCSSSSIAGRYQAPMLTAAAQTGELVGFPASADGISMMVVDAAVYRLGADLTDPGLRRRALVGWVTTSFNLNRALSMLLLAHRNLGAELYYANPGHGRTLVARAGESPRGSFAQSTLMHVEGPWTLIVRGLPVESGLSANIQGLLVALAGGVISVLLGALMLATARSRERAFGLVRERTGQLRHQALHDALTGLPNRTLALDRAYQMLARAHRSHHPVAALYVDVDGFKHINDTFGHAAGDAVLQVFAARLKGAIRDSDTAARLGGDQFVVLTEGSGGDEGPELLAERLLEVLRRPCDVSPRGARPLSVTVSVGVASGLPETPDELLRDADIALHAAKHAGRNRCAVFESGMQMLAHDRLVLEMDLADALASEQFFLVYQPNVNLRSERLIGVEALLRWRHPSRGVMAPNAFIPHAEESGLIVPIGRWVLQEACRHGAEWHAAGHRLYVAVNVSARQLESDQLLEDVRGALSATGLAARFLVLEVTESALMRDPLEATKRLAALKRLGVGIAIDDFGTGYSSLAYLRQFPADTLKIDRSFVAGIAAAGHSTALIRMVVELGKELELQTLAEGIEEHAQLEVLRSHGCDLGQGFLFSRPLEVDAIDELLRARARAAFSAAARKRSGASTDADGARVRRRAPRARTR